MPSYAVNCHPSYQDTLIRLANRRCERFSGQEVGLSIAPPISKEDAALYLDDLHDLHGLDV